LIEFPDLPGILRDGETIEQAAENCADALRSWIETTSSSALRSHRPRENASCYAASIPVQVTSA
jgi:predicted RNase H-like HicB family nuclease